MYQTSRHGCSMAGFVFNMYLSTLLNKWSTPTSICFQLQLNLELNINSIYNGFLLQTGAILTSAYKTKYFMPKLMHEYP